MTPQSASRLAGVLRLLALPFAGALQTFTFSPWHLWWLAIPSLLLVLWVCLPMTPRQLLRAGWLFGLGLFGSGVSWVYISVHDYGSASVPMAGALTLIFVAGLALFPLLTFWLWGKLAGPSQARRLWLFPALWVLGDWLRGWLLTGFPWLYLGTAHVDGPLAGWAPLVGVHGITLLLLASSALLWRLISLRKRPTLAALAGVLAAAPWLAGLMLQPVQWTTPLGKPLSVVTMQGNIPQMLKWDPEFLGQQIRIYLDLTEEDWTQDLILWPETAIPLPHDQAEPLLEHLREELAAGNGTLITGIPWYGYDERVQRMTYHNSMTALGNGSGYYHKQKLVPFGEYVPLENWVRGLIAFFDLPMSSFTRGPAQQSPLRVNTHAVMPFVCYEIAYPDFVARLARGTHYLVTVSNDAWFGASIGPIQHLQIARMRALETGRYILRGTNNGVSALIDPQGRIIARTGQFTREILRGELQPVQGDTPYMQSGSWPVLTLALILIVFCRERRQASA